MPQKMKQLPEAKGKNASKPKGQALRNNQLQIQRFLMPKYLFRNAVMKIL